MRKILIPLLIAGCCSAQEFKDAGKLERILSEINRIKEKDGHLDSNTVVRETDRSYWISFNGLSDDPIENKKPRKCQLDLIQTFGFLNLSNVLDVEHTEYLNLKNGQEKLPMEYLYYTCMEMDAICCGMDCSCTPKKSKNTGSGTNYRNLANGLFGLLILPFAIYRCYKRGYCKRNNGTIVTGQRVVAPPPANHVVPIQSPFNQPPKTQIIPSFAPPAYGDQNASLSAQLSNQNTYQTNYTSNFMSTGYDPSRYASSFGTK